MTASAAAAAERSSPDPAQERSSLRFLTCGSVDDGKSTLIGRLLYDSKALLEDHLETLRSDTRRHGATGDELDFALLTDGLEAEREQKITIDVAYRFFTTPQRAFVVIDAPGHEQYTRNMATGASNADLAVILVDARKGVLTQTRRHSSICAMFGIRHAVLAVNKMDLVDFSEDVFRRTVADYLGFVKELGFASIVPIPISARFGDNLVEGSPRTRWFEGPTLLAHLTAVDVESGGAARPFRFPVQWVNRPNPDFRGYCGTIASGRIARGDRVVVAGSGEETTVERIVTYDGDLDSAETGDAVTLTLSADTDLARGDVLAPVDRRPETADQFAARVVWLDHDPLLPGRAYLLRLGTQAVPARVTSLRHRFDVETRAPQPARTLGQNQIGVCHIATSQPVVFDAFADNPKTGAFILIDRASHATVGAGTIDYALRRATNIEHQPFTVDKAARAAMKGQTPFILWFTGLSGAGKSTVANLVERALHARGVHTYALDGDNLRHGLNRDLGFTDADRVENIRRAGEVAKLLLDAGLVVLCSFISPFRAERQGVRELVGDGEFIEVFVDAPLDECMRRDPKGLYARALAGKMANFTGLHSPYEPPLAPEIVLDTARRSPEEAAAEVLRFLKSLALPTSG